MNRDEMFTRIKTLNSGIEKAQKYIDEANKLLKESLPSLLELLESTRDASSQTSLSEFTNKTEIPSNINAGIVAKELFTLEDINKMLMEV